ncbi:SDR family NAD(P)-dependent oxidoreductase [Sutcliffiella sp. NPDC057660]|uniref:SDR family NAD(P)-dependent oxidoreductase n=1 Tax=Sutcliffiella sp. NPDC057660 TaxID=3346199 RepID=UPI003681FD61
MNNQTVLITGASNGIGKELAYHFAKDKYSLILVARSVDKLEMLAAELREKYAVEVKVKAKDISNEDAIHQLAQELKDENVKVDVLVNNAGYGLFGDFVTTDVKDELGMIDLNVRSLTLLSKLFLPGMLERDRGGILNVASVAAFMPGPFMAVYYATKAFVLSFSEALANEVKGTNITVSALCPGPTETGFGDRADLGKSKLFDGSLSSAEIVAQVAYREFKKGKVIVVPGMQNKFLTKLIRFLPREAVTNIVRSVQAKK